MIVPLRFACIGTSAILGFSAYRGFHAHAATYTNRVYTSVRQEWELNQLLSLPNPLLVNFCMYTDLHSKNVSKALENVIKSGDTDRPVNCVDVEVDEPGTRELLLRFLVSKIPTVVALEGGERVMALEPKNTEVAALENEIREWIKELK